MAAQINQVRHPATADPAELRAALTRSGAHADVAAVVVTYQPDQAQLQLSLAAVLCQVGHIWVIDNASEPPPSGGHLADIRVSVLHLQQNQGVATAKTVAFSWPWRPVRNSSCCWTKTVCPRPT